jgi:hypothetical protein
MSNWALRVRVVVTEGRDVSVATRSIRSTDPICEAFSY